MDLRDYRDDAGDSDLDAWTRNRGHRSLMRAR
jgi:hypothetical protein